MMGRPLIKRLTLLLKKSIPFLFYGLLIVFLYFYLRHVDWKQLAGIQVNWWYIGVAVMLGLGARYWGAFIWFTILVGLGAQNLTNKGHLLYVYAKSWMGRYIPGKAPWILGKIYFASRLGISRNKLAVSSVMEAGLQILVTLIIASLLLVFDHRLDVIDFRMKLLMSGVILLGIILMIPAVFNRCISWVYKIFRKKEFPVEHHTSWKITLRASALYIIQVTLTGFALFFVAKAAYPVIEYRDALYIIGAACLAASVGMLTVFAPSGLGVRDGIQLVLFSLIMPTEFALVVVVITRLLNLLLDLVFWGLTWPARLKQSPAAPIPR